MNIPKLIVMLTHHDQTVRNASEIFEACRNSKAEYFGFKETPLPPEEMRDLFSRMRSCGKKTVLEVVDYTEDGGLAGAKLAAFCGCDILMGTCYYISVHEYCKKHDLQYFPFVGRVKGRPSVLEGSWQEMADEANRLLARGVDGVDLLGYRYVGDANDLNHQVVSHANGPVCIAGSINSYQRLDEVVSAGAWSFTIGGAFFEKRFGEDFSKQIDLVCDYVRAKALEKHE